MSHLPVGNSYYLTTPGTYQTSPAQPVTGIGNITWTKLAGTAYVGDTDTPPAPAPKPIHQQEPFRGWRAYSLGDSGQLLGARMPWESKRMVAACADSDFNRYMAIFSSFSSRFSPETYEAVTSEISRSPEIVCVEHLTEATCGCGIYLRARPDYGGLVYARCIAWGTVAADAEGNARASVVEIEELFINRITVEPSWFGRYIDYDRMAYDIRIRYEVPVTVVDDMEEFMKKLKPEKKNRSRLSTTLAAFIKEGKNMTEGPS